MKIKRKILAAVLLLLAAALAGCGNDKRDSVVTGQYYNPDKAEKEIVQEETTEMGTAAAQDETLGNDVFLITENNMQAECLFLEQLASGKEYMYYYSVTTQFLDKYGNRAAVSEFEPGRIITIGKKDIQGRLLQAQISNQVWEYPEVKRYSVDEERGIFAIADTNYAYDENLFIYSDGNRQGLSDLTELDTLRIVGAGRKILSIAVTTGHGELQLENTSVFEGSFIQIGSKIFSEITADMSMELQEGTYVVAVANNGYGGSTEIEIKPGEKTVLDLDTLKGEGPKTGEILFAVDVEGAIMQIDGKVVDYSQAVPIRYGVHTLTVTADSYDTYSKKLFVNSEKATIVVGLSGEALGSASADTTDTEQTASDKDENTTSADNNQEGNQTTAGNLAGSLAGSHTSGDSSDDVSNVTSDAQLDAIVDELLGDDEDSTSDYLSTLTELLGSLADTDEE